MSEYWISKKKYYCQYCEIYIADDVPSRTQHENGLRHKGNKDRFIRSIYKAGIKKKQDSEEEKREMKRVEEAAQAAYARDVSSGLIKPGALASASTALAPAPKPKPPPAKPSNPFANYTTAASLGITDPDIERLTVQAVARGAEGRVGEWVAVVPPPPPLPQEDGEAAAIDGVKPEPGASAGDVRKREEGPEDDEGGRHFKLGKKTVSVGLGEIYDPGIIQIKSRAAAKVKGQAEAGPSVAPGPLLECGTPQSDGKRPVVDAVPKATVMPVWTRREWKWAGGENTSEEPSQSGRLDKSLQEPSQDVAVEEAAVAVKLEDDPGSGYPVASSGAPGDADATLELEKDRAEAKPTLNNIVKEEPQSSLESTGQSLFRKRKIAGGTSTRGRRKF